MLFTEVASQRKNNPTSCNWKSPKHRHHIFSDTTVYCFISPRFYVWWYIFTYTDTDIWVIFFNNICHLSIPYREIKADCGSFFVHHCRNKTICNINQFVLDFYKQKNFQYSVYLMIKILRINMIDIIKIFVQCFHYLFLHKASIKYCYYMFRLSTTHKTNRKKVTVI